MRTAPLARVLLAVALVAATSAVVAPAAADDLDYQPPVDAPIIDHFRPPPAKWAAGNRGIDYGTAAGTPVNAAEQGVVEFAGQVAGALHVVVRHPDGLRSSYSFLASIDVVEGQQVARGTMLGSTGTSLHFGVRAGDTYIDPELVLRGAAFSVHLVAAEGQTEAQRRLGEMIEAALLDELTDGGGFSVRGSVSRWLRSAARESSSMMQLAVHYMGATSPQTHMARALEAMWRWYERRGSCTSPSDVAAVMQQPTADHLAITVAGFGSASTLGAGVDTIDLASAGISSDRVMRFSYNGGRAPDSTGDAFASIEATTYTSTDSQQALEPVAERLADAIAEVAAANPGAPIDVLGHSQGGVVALRAIQIAAERGELPANVRLVTVASPHRGDTMATGADLLSHGVLHEAALDLAERQLDMFTDGAHDDGSVNDLSMASSFMDRYHDAGVPDGVFAVSIGGRWDPVVPARDTLLSGAANITFDYGGLGAHGRLPSAPAVTTQVGLAIRGVAPTCEGFVDALADHAATDIVGTAEDLLVLGIW